MKPEPPTYVADFPDVNAVIPGFLNQTVVLEAGILPDGESGWITVHGDQCVAQNMVLAAQGDKSIEATVQGWINDSQARDHASRDWRRRWSANLAENPQIQDALERSPDDLYQRAGLKIAEQIAMHAWTKLKEDGKPRSTREIARELKEAESTIRDRIESAVTKLRGLRHIAAAVA